MVKVVSLVVVVVVIVVVVHCSSNFVNEYDLQPIIQEETTSSTDQ